MNRFLQHERCVTTKAGPLTRWSEHPVGFTLLQVTLMVGSSRFPWQGMSRLLPASSRYCLSGVLLNDGGSCFMSNKAASGRLQRFQQWIFRLDYHSFGQDYLNNNRISSAINSLIVELLLWDWVDSYEHQEASMSVRKGQKNVISVMFLIGCDRCGGV